MRTLTLVALLVACPALAEDGPHLFRPVDQPPVPVLTLDNSDPARYPELEPISRVEASVQPEPQPPALPPCLVGGKIPEGHTGCVEPDGSQVDEPPPPTMRLSVLAGALVSLSSDTDTAGAPLARVAVDWDLAPGVRTPDMFLTADFTALPGETVSLGDPETFRALEFELGIRERPFKSIAAWLYAAGGFATRLPDNPEPLVRTARWLGGGLEFRSRRGDFLRVGLTADQRFDGRFRSAVSIAGAVELYEEKGGALRGGKVSLVGRALLGLDYASARGAPARHDIVTVGLAVGR